MEIVKLWTLLFYLIVIIVLMHIYQPIMYLHLTFQLPTLQQTSSGDQNKTEATPEKAHEKNGNDANTKRPQRNLFD